MTHERERRIHELFTEVLELEPDRRAGFLDGTSADTREEIEALLEAHARMGDFLATPAPDRFGSEARAPFDPGTRIGAYRIVRAIGAGGAGTVYEAEQDSPHRRVALKIMHAGLATETTQRRFRDEAEILARLEHPDVAHVYEAGVHEGVPWFAMEFVAEARTIVEHAAGLDTGERLRLFARVCDAIHHGHQKGIIHRDIKPSNVLIHASGRPKVIDFGVARVEGLSPDRREIVGTIPYMSPEQFEPGETHLDLRSDVYSLGVLLYELLAGTLPYDVTSTSITEATRVIREEPPAALDKALRGDIEAIVRKALEKDRERRYPSAAALAADLRRHLEHRPVEAVPATLLYQVRKFARRQRVAFAAITGIVLVSIAAAVVSGWFAVERARESRRAEFQAYVANLAAADAALRIRDVAEAGRRLRQAPPELRNWEWFHLVSRLDRSVSTLELPVRTAIPASFANSASRVIGGTWDPEAIRSELMVWDTETGETILHHGPIPRDIRSATLSPDGRWVAWGSASGTLTLTDAESLSVRVPLGRHADEVNRVAFSADGRWLATASSDGSVALWSVPGGECVRVFEEEELRFRDVAISPVHGRLAASTAAPESLILVWEMNADSPREIRGHAGTVARVRFDADGSRLLSVSADTTVRIWDAASGEELHTLGRRGDLANDAVFSDDGTQVLVGYRDGTLTLWDAAEGVEIDTLWGHTHSVTCVAFGAEPGTVLSSSYDGTIKTWRPDPADDARILARHDSLVRDVAYSRDGRWFAGACFDGLARVYERATGAVQATLEGHDGEVTSVAFGPRGDFLATGSNDCTVKLWNWASGECLATLRNHVGGVSTVAISPNGSLLAAGSTDRTASVWEIETRRRLHSSSHGSWVSEVVFSPDGDRLAIVTRDGTLAVREAAADRELIAVRAHESAAYCGTFDPTGEFFATGSGLGEIKLWEVSSGRCLGTHFASGREVQDLAFTPDGARLAGAVADRIKIWDARTLLPVLELRGHKNMVWSVAFSPDGTQLASGGGWHLGEDCTIRLWGNVSGVKWPPTLD